MCFSAKPPAPPKAPPAPPPTPMPQDAAVKASADADIRRRRQKADSTLLTSPLGAPATPAVPKTLLGS